MGTCCKGRHQLGKAFAFTLYNRFVHDIIPDLLAGTIFILIFKELFLFIYLLFYNLV
jgi:hypothetical protein